MSDENADLRARIARADPAPRHDALLRAVTADEIRERTMQTIDDTPAIHPAPARRRRPLLLALGAAAVTALAVVTVTARGGGTSPAPAPTTLALTAPSSTAISSCLAFDVAFLRDMPVAFAGTVTAAAPGSVTFDVTRWYRGGTADVVTVTQPEGTSVALDGVEFTAGGRYLVTATDGTVNGCGYSGPATPDLEKSFGEAFGA